MKSEQAVLPNPCLEEEEEEEERCLVQNFRQASDIYMRGARVAQSV
jgi:hypothetical protein